MIKKYFAYILLTSFVLLPAYAADAIFSNSDSEKFNLEPLNYSSYKPIVASSSTTSAPSTSILNTSSDLQSKNFQSAINNLDTAQVEIREQLANYSTLMAQSKANYESKKSEYKSYKKQYNTLKRKMRNVEKSKKIIQGNIYVKNSVQN